MATCLFFRFPAINLAILPWCTEPSGLLSRFVTSPNNVTLTALRADAVLDVGQCASTDTITALVAADEGGSAGASTCGRGAAARAD
jgi:hypothetical protein